MFNPIALVTLATLAATTAWAGPASFDASETDPRQAYEQRRDDIAQERLGGALAQPVEATVGSRALLLDAPIKTDDSPQPRLDTQAGAH